ncbi:MAG: DNA polymerase I [Elusimicrobia bacterium]|nr:DNA polymerase I [Candidatus Liberimonas magnetica]
MSKLYLIDGNAYIHRAYHALPPLTTSKGEMVNAVYGFIRMVLKVVNSKKPEYLVVCFDYPAKTFRHKEYPLYKAHRKVIDDELKSQMPLAREAIKALNIVLLEKEGYEGDDIIATLAQNAKNDGAEVIIITGDKDALQLVDEKINVWNEQKDVLYTEEKVKEKYGVEPSQLVEMFALMGDSSDNVPGVKGIGEKTATKLIQEYGSLNGVYENLDSVKGKTKELLANSKEDALKSRSLVTLDRKVQVGLDWHDAKLKEINAEKATEFFKRLEFHTLVKEFSHPAPASFDSAALNPVPADPVLKEQDKVISNTIFSQKDLDLLVKKMRKEGLVSLDLETDDVNPFKAKIVGLSFACDSSQGYYIPVGHDYLGSQEQMELKQVLNTLKDILEDKNIKKYGQNIKYDLIVLKNNGISLYGIYFDTMVASYCLNPSRTNHGLKDIVLDYLGIQMTRIEELIGEGKNQTTMDKVEVQKAAEYACADAVMVFRLAQAFKEMLTDKKLDKLFNDVEMPLVEILASMEENGIKIDDSHFKKLSKEFSVIAGELEKEIYKIAGQEFNPNSPKQLSFILFEKLKLPTVRKTKTGFSTDEEVLKILSSQHELPKKLIEYREIQKLKSTYIDSLIELSEKETNRVHTSFNQTITSTGRLSSSNPNLQNIPVKSDYGKMIRRGFICEPDNILLSADYSQIDLRVLAHITQDQALMSAFKNNEDVHSTTAREVFGKADPDLRRIAKTINFGIVYGQSAFSLAQQLGIPNHQAKEYIDNYFIRYKGVKEWMECIVKEAQKNGYVSTLLGRIRYIPEINAKNGQIRAGAERIALNTPIQGTSADIIKVAMVEIEKKIGRDRDKEKTKMLLQVHDELLFELTKGRLKHDAQIIKKIMETAVKLDVPVTVDLKAGPNWMDMEKI